MSSATYTKASVDLVFPDGTVTSSATMAGFGSVDVVQEVGTSTTAVMSQKAVTDCINSVEANVEEAATTAASDLINVSATHITNTNGSSEVALQSSKRYFIEGTDATQSQQITMVLSGVTSKTNIEVFCKFSNGIVLAFEHPNTTIESFSTETLENAISKLNNSATTGVGYLYLRFVGLKDNQCAVLINV